jgi:hypothetical protein
MQDRSRAKVKEPDNVRRWRARGDEDDSFDLSEEDLDFYIPREKRFSFQSSLRSRQFDSTYNTRTTHRSPYGELKTRYRVQATTVKEKD